MFGVEGVSFKDVARAHRDRMNGLDMVEGRRCVTHLVRVALRPAPPLSLSSCWMHKEEHKLQRFLPHKQKGLHCSARRRGSQGKHEPSAAKGGPTVSRNPPPRGRRRRKASLWLQPRWSSFRLGLTAAARVDCCRLLQLRGGCSLRLTRVPGIAASDRRQRKHCQCSGATSKARGHLCPDCRRLPE